MILPIYSKVALVSAVIIVIFGSGYHFGELKATKVYLPMVEKLKAAIDASNQAAKLIAQNQEEMYVKTKAESANLANRIHNHYRMLSNKNDTNSVTDSSIGNDETSCERGFVERCALDAGAVIVWQQWAIGNQIPVR